MAIVLLVDPSQTIRRIVEMAFKGTGHDVVTATSGAEGRQALGRYQPSAVIINYLLPDGSGLKLCRELKADPQTAGYPIAILGGVYGPFDEGEARQAGADRIIMKPFETAALLEPIEALMAEGASVRSTRPHPSAHAEPAPEPIVAAEPEPSYTPTPAPSYTPTPEPSYTPTPEPSYTPTPEPTYAATAEPEPSYAPTPEPEPSYTPTPEPEPEPDLLFDDDELSEPAETGYRADYSRSHSKPAPVPRVPLHKAPPPPEHQRETSGARYAPMTSRPTTSRPAAVPVAPVSRAAERMAPPPPPPVDPQLVREIVEDLLPQIALDTLQQMLADWLEARLRNYIYELVQQELSRYR